MRAVRTASARSRGAAWILRGTLAALALSFVPAPGRGDPAAPNPAAPAPGTPQQQASLDALDRVLVRFGALLARDDDARHRAATATVLAALRKRRDALRLAFDQAKCDDLRAEVNLEFHRLAAWMAPPAP